MVVLRLATANPATKRSQDELKMDGCNHAESASEALRLVALECDRVFGHYAHGVLPSLGDILAFGVLGHYAVAWLRKDSAERERPQLSSQRDSLGTVVGEDRRLAMRGGGNKSSETREIAVGPART